MRSLTRALVFGLGLAAPLVAQNGRPGLAVLPFLPETKGKPLPE